MATQMQKDAVGDKAKRVPGKDPDLYRTDPYGNEVCRHPHGLDSEKGWQIDHIKPAARGGSDDTRNLQVLHTGMNREKSDSLQKKRRHSKFNK